VPLTIYKNADTSTIDGPRVISQTTAAEIRKMLSNVTAAGGTAPDAEVAGYSVGGKTGTAYKHGPHGYDHSHYRASFVGIAPISAPRIVVAVSIDDPTGGSHFGGQVAGPAFSSIAGDTLRALNVAPDLPIKSMATSTTAQDASVPAKVTR
jgi:cell division protein FtsI (penicillin-binding protein 3)